MIPFWYQKSRNAGTSCIPYLRIFSFIDSKTGVIGIDIKFAEALGEDFQLLAYATYPKAAIIDNTGACQVVDNV